MSVIDLRHLGAGEKGSATVELGLIAPMLFFLVMACIEMALALFQWNAAAKATQLGARAAIVSAPVAVGLNQVAWNYTLAGEPCQDLADGGSTGACPQINVTCRGAASGGTCDGGATFSDAAFGRVYDRMRLAYPALQRENVAISYRSNGLGFVANPYGLPMTVTVSFVCGRFDFIVIDALVDWLTPLTVPGCPGNQPGIPMPSFAAGRTGEDYETN